MYSNRISLAVEGNPDGRCNLAIGVPASAWLRQAVIVSLTAAVLCPLSLLKDLSALSFLPSPYPSPNPNPNL